MTLRRIRSLYQFGPGASSLEDYVRALQIGGVVYPGTLNWETFPRDATSASVTGGAANTDGSATTVVNTGEVPVPFYLTHLVTMLGAAGSRIRWTIQESTTTRRIIRDASRVDSDDDPTSLKIAPPYQAQPGAEINLIIAESVGAQVGNAYLTVMRGSPLPVPLLMNRQMPVQQLTAPGNAPDVEILGVGAGSVLGTWGEYQTVLAPQASPILIPGLTLKRKQRTSIIVAFATKDALGVNTDWGRFGIPNQQVSSDEVSVYLDLTPFWQYIPAGTEVTARTQYVGELEAPPANMLVGFSYLVLV